MAGARLGLIAASLLEVGAIGCGWTAQRRVASNAQIVFMAPVKASSLGKRGYELVTMNLDGSNRGQITDNDQQEFLPHFSPDGTSLLYTKFSQGAYGEPDSRSDVVCRLTTCLDVDYLQAMAKRYQNRIELLQGTLDMLILQTLRWGPQHGYGIAAAIRAGSQEVLQVETGSLYPALHRMEKQGWVKSEWKQTENNQRAKFYNLTAAGRKHLAAEQSRWHQMTGAIAGLMNRGEA